MAPEKKLSANFSLNSETGTPPEFERKTVECQDFGTRFVSSSKNYAKQFFQVYSRRLEELRPILTEKVQKKWGSVKLIKLSELNAHEGEQCIIIGTLFKHQFWKPSILRELRDDTEESIIFPEKKENYCSEKDQVFLEDELLRIKIVGAKMNIEEVVTGVVCALMGKKLDDGSFEVDDWCFPGCPPSRSVKNPPSNGKLLFVSGLDLVSNQDSLPRSLLVEWLTGMAGTVASQEEVASVVNVLIAGNSVRSKEDEDHLSKGLLTSRAQKSKVANEISAATEKFDKFLAEIVPHCGVTLMPGQYDPTNMMLPQKPIQPFMLQESHRYKNLKGVTNPWIGIIGNRLISGSSGQPIEDILRTSGGTDVTPLQWLEKTLDFRHYCPTAPDTLPSYPFHEKDLFIMQECPDIYFTGNTEKFATKLWKGETGQTVRLICIPKFSTTSTGVLVDLQTLEVEQIHFGADNM